MELRKKQQCCSDQGFSFFPPRLSDVCQCELFSTLEHRVSCLRHTNWFNYNVKTTEVRQGNLFNGLFIVSQPAVVEKKKSLPASTNSGPEQNQNDLLYNILLDCRFKGTVHSKQYLLSHLNQQHFSGASNMGCSILLHNSNSMSLNY